MCTSRAVSLWWLCLRYAGKPNLRYVAAEIRAILVVATIGLAQCELDLNIAPFPL